MSRRPRVSSASRMWRIDWPSIELSIRASLFGVSSPSSSTVLFRFRSAVRAIMKIQEQNGFKLRSLFTTTMPPLLRAQLRSRPANGHTAFLPQLRKIVFEFCDKWPSSANTATYLLSAVQSLARQNPHVEVVVKQRNQKEPIVRGFYRTYMSSISTFFAPDLCI